MQTKRQPSSRRPYRIAALAAASDKGSGEKGHFQSRASIVFPPEATSEVEECRCRCAGREAARRAERIRGGMGSWPPGLQEPQEPQEHRRGA
ncbi:unnamed protein product [Rangifer tarandus platyrhynchus]|uniref:Uncharacterized protein n=1 Tax=Rangifer tarandus platyrhynchus TaxID=3082113 RepID=A0ABN8YZD1_RANTA|nr:unnamed protein product [Rangifer tarandus platyrhynchus]